MGPTVAKGRFCGIMVRRKACRLWGMRGLQSSGPGGPAGKRGTASLPGDTALYVTTPHHVADGYQEDVVTPTFWVRVDDRLLHGQVTVAWRQHLLPDEIWIVDDLVRADPFLADVLCMAAPAGVTIHIYSVPEAISAWAAHINPASADPLSTRACATPPNRSLGPCARPCLLLVKTPQVALALAQGGLLFSHLNVGNISPGPGSRRVFRTISLAPEHIAALDALAQRGVSITFQLTPEDSQMDWQTIRRQHPDF